MRNNFLCGRKFAFTLAEGATHVVNSKVGRKFAFTLAEVLVTIGILGVVSAMTIPTLAGNWQKRSYVTQLHKVYNEIQSSFVSEMNRQNAGNLIEAGLRSYQESAFAQRHFKIVKKCNISWTPCFASSYRSINGSTSSTSGGYGNSFVFVTGSGAAVNIILYNTVDENATLGTIYVDINGPRNPNVAGRDFFKMYIYPDGVLDAEGVTPNCRRLGTGCPSGGSARASRESRFNSYCKSSTLDNNGGCFAKILNDNWEMKY